MNKAVAVALLMVVACGDGTGPESSHPTTVLVSPEAAELETLHRTVRLTATVTDQNGATMDNASVTWSSEDTTGPLPASLGNLDLERRGRPHRAEW